MCVPVSQLVTVVFPQPTNTAAHHLFLSEPARAITERVLSLPAVRECDSISCYLSMESGEVRTVEIVDAIFRSSVYPYPFFYDEGFAKKFLKR